MGGGAVIWEPLVQVGPSLTHDPSFGPAGSRFQENLNLNVEFRVIHTGQALSLMKVEPVFSLPPASPSPCTDPHPSWFSSRTGA